MASPAIPHDARPSAAPVKLPVVTNPNRPASKVVKSADPLYDAAVAQAKASLAAEQAPILGQQTASDAYYKQRATDATANASALAQLLKGIGPAEQTTYDTAAQNQSLLANGFSHGLQDALQGNTDSLNATLKSLGSPATLDSHATSTGDVLQGLGGYIPASQMTREGAGFAAAANMLPATALLQGGENVKAIGASGDAAHTGFDNKLAELAAKLPGDVQTNYLNLQKLALDNKKFALQVEKNQFDRAYKTGLFNLQKDKYKTSIDEFNTRTALSVKRLNLDAQKFARQTLTQDRSYAIQLEKLGIAQAKAQRDALAAEYKLQNGGYSQKDLLKFNTELQKRINDIVTGTGKDGKPTYTVNGTPITFSDFVKYAVAKGVPPSLAIERAKQFFDPSAIPPGAGLHLPLGQAGNEKATSVVQAASGMLGTPYVWGGNQPGKALDCSGFLQQSYEQAGIKFPWRTTYEQVKHGKPVKLDALQPGDAIFTIPGKQGPEHVAMYIGNGQVQVSPSTGDVNKIVPLQDYLKLGFVAARRYLP